MLRGRLSKGIAACKERAPSLLVVILLLLMGVPHLLLLLLKAALLMDLVARASILQLIELWEAKSKGGCLAVGGPWWLLLYAV